MSDEPALYVCRMTMTVMMRERGGFPKRLRFRIGFGKVNARSTGDLFLDFVAI